MAIGFHYPLELSRLADVGCIYANPTTVVPEESSFGSRSVATCDQYPESLGLSGESCSDLSDVLLYFTTLPADAKSPYAFLLPIIKIFLRNVMSRTVVHLNDEIPEVVLMNVEVFNSLFMSYVCRTLLRYGQHSV
ncbi:hypothetical protein GQ600_2394 [Phytophthora cactorum]|nr:hypothetical protein GQ600_2394 [Phytophthora cactorum]